MGKVQYLSMVKVSVLNSGLTTLILLMCCCCSGFAEDEHDVTWFHLEKDQTYECPVCTQVFQVTARRVVQMVSFVY